MPSAKALTNFRAFEIPPTAGYVEVTVDSSDCMAIGQFHDLSDGVCLMRGVIRDINGNVITFANVPQEDGDTEGSMGGRGDRPAAPRPCSDSGSSGHRAEADQ